MALRGAKTVEEHRETLEHIVRLTQQMGRLIEDLLFLSRAEVGAIRFDMQPIALQDVLDIALAEGRVLAAANGLLLRRRWCPTKPAWCEGDPERLVQALLIAIDNAVKYSDDGGTIEVGLACGAPEATITIRNPGPDIPEADLPFVFNRFYRGRQAVDRVTTGSGLGLPIAKWVVDTHGGHVALASRDRETVLTIALPTAA